MKVDRKKFIEFLEANHPEKAIEFKANKQIMMAEQVEVKTHFQVLKFEGEKEDGDGKEPVEIIVGGDDMETVITKVGASP